MSQKFSSVLLQWLRKRYHLILAFCWISGLICGTMVYYSAADSLVSVMRGSIDGTVSIVGLLCVNLLPFLLSAFAVYLSAPVMLFPICFGKAFLAAFVSAGILHAFGSAGWIFRCFLLFSDCVALPVLYWYWLRCLPCSGNRFGFTWRSICLMTVCIGIGSIDFRIISPFLARLIDF